MRTASRTSRDLGWVLVLILTVFAVAPLTYPGFFETHSGFLPTFNVCHLAEAPNWGRAAEGVQGEGKLPYLLAWPFFKMTGDCRAAIRWGYGLAFILGALEIYGWTRRWLGVAGAILASTVYTYVPWHLSAVYVRGAYAEAWLWAIWPWILWAIDGWAGPRTAMASELISQSERYSTLRRRVMPGIVALLAWAAAFWIEPGLCALATPLLVAYIAVVHGRPSWPPGVVLGVTALSFVGLWIAGRIVPPDGSPFGQHFLYPFQLFAAGWGYGVNPVWESSGTGTAPGSGPAGQGAMSFQLGLAALGLSLAALALLVRNWSELGARFRRAWLFWGLTLVTVALLTLPIAAAIWETSGFDIFLTHPWQLLAVVGLPLAFLAGSVVPFEAHLADAGHSAGAEPEHSPARTVGSMGRTTVLVWCGLVAFAVLASAFYLEPRFTQVNPGPQPVAMFQAVEAEAPQLLILETQITPPAEITSTLTFTLTWQAIVPVNEDYTVFVHLLDDAGTKLAQQDTRPCGGACPTHTWQPGEIVADRHSLLLPADAAAGPYRLAVGLYRLESGERAAVVGRDDGTVVLHVQ
jgi:hypothetical protein